MSSALARTIPALLLMALTVPAAAQLTLTEGTNLSVDAAGDGRLVIDLAGGLWIVPPRGGGAVPIVTTEQQARRPRWSPAGDRIAYEARAEGRMQLFVLDLETSASTLLGGEHHFDQHPAWHPDGSRITFSSDRRTSGFDIWETDVATGLGWRMTSLPGDETEPAWSRDGRNLAYIHFDQGTWSLMVREFGRPDRVLVESNERLSAPSWRPDGSLITYLRQREGNVTVDMVILSDPPLERVLISDRDIFLAPVTWRDRDQLVYTANGVIRARSFNAWTSRTLPFRADIAAASPAPEHVVVKRELEEIDPPTGQRIVRAARLYDGISDRYRDDVDILLEGSRIAAIEPARTRDGLPVVDIGNITVLPGFIDVEARLPGDVPVTLGPLLLSFGLTTIVVATDEPAALNEAWSSDATPGPRVLVEPWQPALDAGTAIMLGDEEVPPSPAGRRYADIRLAGRPSPTIVLSGLADSATPGLDSLLASRQARLLPMNAAPTRRFGGPVDIEPMAMTVALASQPSGLPAGIGLHAELRALAAAGLTPRQALKASGVNAATILGLPLELGRISIGATADLVLVDGDPLHDINDALNVVGIVRNGRFFSTIGLIEKSRGDTTVE